MVRVHPLRHPISSFGLRIKQMIHEMQFFKRGLTVKELRDILEDMPDTDADGIPTEVWLGSTDEDANSSPCTAVWPLNVSGDGKTRSCDLLLEYDN